MEIKTLGDLKEFLNTLNESQLQQPATVTQIEDYVEIGEAYVSEETYFHNEDSEGIIPVSEYDPEHWGVPLEDPYNKIVPPGRVFIWEMDYEAKIKDEQIKNSTGSAE